MSLTDRRSLKRQKPADTEDPPPPDPNNTFSDVASDSLQQMERNFDRIQAIRTPYPDFKPVAEILRQQSSSITDITVRSFFDKHIHRLRVYSPETPSSLNSIILQIITTCNSILTTSTHLPVASAYVLALAWASLKTVSTHNGDNNIEA